MTEITLRLTDPFLPQSIALMQAMWEELGELYGDTGPCQLLPEHVAGEGAAFVVAWHGEEAVACGGLRPHEPGIAEVKRIYVKPEVRNQGVARRILLELEAVGRNLGYERLHLETGTPQVYAVRLYENLGYERIAPFGPYADDPLTVCFGKDIVP